MNNTKIFLAFVGGAIIGSILTWKCVKEKYEKIAQEEIDSVKERFSKREKKDSEKENGINVRDEHEKEVDKYHAVLQKERYGGNREEGCPVERPYVISPEDFGELDEYEKVSLTYYADGVLTDEDDEVIDDVEDIIGEDSLTHFGEYEDDSVFVRNDILKTDYEILLDQRNYSEVRKSGTYRREV